MKRKILIEAYEINEKGLPVLSNRIIAGHLDATRNITVLSECITIREQNSKPYDIHIPEKIERFNICNGMITIYYQGGNFLEISRFFEGEPFTNA